jgi:hypothetical protein
VGLGPSTGPTSPLRGSQGRGALISYRNERRKKKKIITFLHSLALELGQSAPQDAIIKRYAADWQTRGQKLTGRGPADIRMVIRRWSDLVRGHEAPISPAPVPGRPLVLFPSTPRRRGRRAHASTHTPENQSKYWQYPPLRAVPGPSLPLGWSGSRKSKENGQSKCD